METIAGHIEKFEKDIKYDAHSFIIRLSRSDGAKALMSLKLNALEAIAAHLRQHRPDDTNQLLMAWCTLLSWISYDNEISKGTPSSLADLDAWIAWAEKNAR